MTHVGWLPRGSNYCPRVKLAKAQDKKLLLGEGQPASLDSMEEIFLLPIKPYTICEIRLSNPGWWMRKKLNARISKQLGWAEAVYTYDTV